MLRSIFVIGVFTIACNCVYSMEDKNNIEDNLDESAAPNNFNINQIINYNNNNNIDINNNNANAESKIKSIDDLTIDINNNFLLE